MPERAVIGELVAIVSGRHAGRVGFYLRDDLVYSGQVRLYPIVLLPEEGQVRVTSVRPAAFEDEFAPYLDEQLKDPKVRDAYLAEARMTEPRARETCPFCTTGLEDHCLWHKDADA